MSYEPDPVLKTGDRVSLDFEGRTINASVALASENGFSLMLAYEGILGGYVGMMPVLWKGPRAGYRDMIGDRRVAIRKNPVDDRCTQCRAEGAWPCPLECGCPCHLERPPRDRGPG